MIKAIIFDVDGVLVDSRESNIAWYEIMFTHAGYPKPSREEILGCFHMPLYDSIPKITGVKDKKEIERIWKLAQDPELRRKRDSNLYEFPEKLEEILNKLKDRYRLAIVTSRIRVGVDDIFSVKEIEKLFDVIVTYEDYDNPKPHPEPLLVALEKLSLSANEAIYIGDSDTDIDAARDAGMKSIHLSRSKHPDAEAGVDEFQQLIAAIDSIA